MRDYEEKSYYEIQLDNKQLILVFLAGVTVCVLIFVLGVMIGKGQKEAEFAAASRNEKNSAAPEPDQTSPPQPLSDIASEARVEEKPAPKEPVQEKPAPKERVQEKSEPVKENKKEPTKLAAADDKKKEKYAYEDLDKTEQTADAEVKKTTKESAPLVEAEISPDEEAKPSGNSRYTVQVMATSSKPKAQEQVTRLKSKGYKPFMDESRSGEISVFKVRVGRFTDTEEAREMASRIKSDLKLETWVAVLD